MQGNRLAGTRAIAQASRSDQFCQQLRVMLHLVLAAELRVFILERVVTMWARGHDLLHLAADKCLDDDETPKAARRELVGADRTATAQRSAARALLLDLGCKHEASC